MTSHRRWWGRGEEAEHAALMGALAAAMTSKDAVGIRRLLAADTTMVIDGGPLQLGGELIGRDVTAVELLSYPSDLAIAGINGAPGIVARLDGQVIATVSAAARDGVLVTLWSVRNPDKLRHWGR
ncbi:hypothetical protein [Microbacterium sp. W4I20]|uniref:hypothetical protein n=1 Tax=Microbacterium sp. W4I20 TaxID=3042262 RepID=UPI002780ED6D|nr:hypothetical protein [Microbacterium sp. W4I20]MDQ0726540.1 hypothetical protein [Microbacterium sp. W4I20]